MFCAEYTKHFNELQSQHDQSLKAHRAEAAKLAKERENIIQAIKDGVAVDLIKDDLERSSERLKELETLLEATPTSAPMLHPAMAERYRRQISDLRASLDQEENRGEAALILRGLIEKIVLTPVPGQDDLSIDLHGSLAGILSIASQENPMKNQATKEKRLARLVANDNYSSQPSIVLVAGAGCQRYLPLVTALDIASKPLQEEALLSAMEGVRSSKEAYSTSNSALPATGGQKNG